MDVDSVQFIKKNKAKPREKTSSFYLMVENMADHEEAIVSKKIQFLDLDAVWWITIGPRTQLYEHYFYPLKCHLETQEYIWNSKLWSYSISLLGNGGHNFDSKLIPIDKHISIYSYNLFENNLGGKTYLELKVQMTMTFQAESSELQKFFDNTVPFKKMIASTKSMLSDTKYSDFTFIVRGTKFKVHKNILGAASPVFDKVFTSNLEETHSNTCYVKDILPTIFQYLLNFIYAGELPKNLNVGDTSRKLFEAAHYYQIEELKDVCKQDVHFKLSVANAEEIYKWAGTYDVDDLKMEAWNVIQWDILEILKPMTPLSCDALTSLFAKKKVHDKWRKEYDFRVKQYQKTLQELN